MKKRKLRSWVKNGLVLLILIGILLINNNYDQSQMEKCISVGHSQEYCEKGLR